MKSFLIVKAGSSFKSIIDKQGDFDEFTINAFLDKPDNTIVLSAQGKPAYPNSDELYGIVITGAHENTTDNESWMIHLKKWIKHIASCNIPMLGICFGHQIIAEALGGEVGFNNNGGEFGVVNVQSNEKANSLLNFNLPNQFNVFASHYQSVIKLPAKAVTIAGNSEEPNHFVCYTNNIWGLQFHPEFNKYIIGVHLQKNKKQGDNISDDKYNEVESFGAQLLNSFYKHCLELKY